ncbi:MAG: hypothetical protein IPM18_14990 [Phycisphaerales bacterium]|nr:hypothetical protein [Phycisphaerales bacterium]
MRFGLRLAFAGLVLALLTGCGMQGSWSVMRMVPENLTEFEIGQMTLKGDGKFEASYNRGGATVSAEGTYTYNEESKVLTFSMKDGKLRSYRAELCGKCQGIMYVWNEEGPKVWEVSFKRH